MIKWQSNCNKNKLYIVKSTTLTSNISYLDKNGNLIEIRSLNDNYKTELS